MSPFSVLVLFAGIAALILGGFTAGTAARPGTLVAVTGFVWILLAATGAVDVLGAWIAANV